MHGTRCQPLDDLLLLLFAQFQPCRSGHRPEAPVIEDMSGR